MPHNPSRFCPPRHRDVSSSPRCSHRASHVAWSAWYAAPPFRIKSDGGAASRDATNRPMLRAKTECWRHVHTCAPSLSFYRFLIHRFCAPPPVLPTITLPVTLVENNPPFNSRNYDSPSTLLMCCISCTHSVSLPSKGAQGVRAVYSFVSPLLCFTLSSFLLYTDFRDVCHFYIYSFKSILKGYIIFIIEGYFIQWSECGVFSFGSIESIESDSP